MTTTGDDLTISGLCAAMRFDHERLEIGARHLLECVLFGRADVVEQAFSRFCAEMMAHLEAEQNYMLPAFEKEHADEAKLIREDHALVRALLATIAEQVARRAATPDTIRKLIEAVRASGEREVKSLYPWAEHGVEMADSRAALEHIQRAETNRKRQKWMI